MIRGAIHYQCSGADSSLEITGFRRHHKTITYQTIECPDRCYALPQLPRSESFAAFATEAGVVVVSHCTARRTRMQRAGLPDHV